MLRKIGFIFCLLIWNISIFSQVFLPSNSIEKSRVNNWIIANDLKFESKNISSTINNINEYLMNILNL